MLKNEVEVGKIYAVKVSGWVQPVQIISTNPYGGWDGINLTSNRKVRIKTAAKLRFRVVNEGDPGEVVIWKRS